MSGPGPSNQGGQGLPGQCSGGPTIHQMLPDNSANSQRASSPTGSKPHNGVDDNPGASNSPWPGFVRRGLRNQLVCVGVALLIWLITTNQRGNLFTAWVYSASIGTLCWFFLDGGRLLVAARLPGRQHLSAYARLRWPGQAWMLACVLLGTALGYTLGTALGDAVTGFSTPNLLNNRPAIALSAVVAVIATWYFYATERLRGEQAAAETARRAAAESQLMLLQSQLEPHMLFNTLANLRVLITLDAARAQAMLDHLINYLRATLGASRAGLHPLSAEFDRLADYLALMAVRMGPRLQVQLDLPAALRDLPVPPLLLQPLVENSIRHGLEPHVAGGRIVVSAARQGQRLLLTVRDTGLGLGAGAASGPGNTVSGGSASATSADSAAAGSHYGTRHVTERLATLYGEQAWFTLREATDADGGTLAEVNLPLPPPQ